MVVQNLDEKFIDAEEKSNSKKVKIILEDIEEEIAYSNSTIVCYILKANPPLAVLEDFVRRIWKNKGVDKVGMIAYGMFIVRFNLAQERDAILQEGYIFFDKKPMVMKSWNHTTNFKKEDIHAIPIWIRLEEIDIK
ncbi:unnamed protein product [Vicia faba]|nr:unnamed protein product [Vicia faba]